MVRVRGNPNPTNPTYPTNPTNPTNPTTKYRCEFVNLFCIYAEGVSNGDNYDGAYSKLVRATDVLLPAH